MNASSNHSGFSLHGWYSSLYDNADPRIRDKFLMGQPHWIILIYAVYYVIMAHVLPRYMRHRKPFDYQKLSLYTDAVLFGLAFYFLIVTSFVWLFIYDWQCEPIDKSDSWLARMSVLHCYAFLLTRFVYTTHNVPFVLSKRTNSLADYLLWHHAVFPIIVWWLINFYPGGHPTFGGFINSLTHVLLIGYKFLVISYPEMKRYRRIFHILMHVFQFCSIALHSLQMFFYNDCAVPMSVVHTEIVGAIIIAGFYIYFVVYNKDSIK